MRFDEYQKHTAETAIYPKETALYYTALGLAGEAGEVANKVKKILRDYGGKLSLDQGDAIGKEIGGVLYYCSELASALGLDLGYIAEQNIKILADRKRRGTLQGSGDDR